jgi:hypothetical protein
MRSCLVIPEWAPAGPLLPFSRGWSCFMVVSGVKGPAHCVRTVDVSALDLARPVWAGAGRPDCPPAARVRAGRLLCRLAAGAR